MLPAYLADHLRGHREAVAGATLLNVVCGRLTEWTAPGPAADRRRRPPHVAGRRAGGQLRPARRAGGGQPLWSRCWRPAATRRPRRGRAAGAGRALAGDRGRSADAAEPGPHVVHAGRLAGQDAVPAAAAAWCAPACCNGCTARSTGRCRTASCRCGWRCESGARGSDRVRRTGAGAGRADRRGLEAESEPAAAVGAVVRFLDPDDSIDEISCPDGELAVAIAEALRSGVS